MNTHQQMDFRVIKDHAISLPPAGRIEVLNHLIERMEREELASLSPKSREALLQALPPLPSLGMSRAVSLEIAERILSTLNVSEAGHARLVLPANVSHIVAMRALNEYFREKVLGMSRPVICEADFDFYAGQLDKSNPEISSERRIELSILVGGTADKNRPNQNKVLKTRGLKFGAVEDAVLVVAAFACKNEGRDLLQDRWIRTSSPGVALTMDQGVGLILESYSDKSLSSHVWACGAPSLPS